MKPCKAIDELKERVTKLEKQLANLSELNVDYDFQYGGKIVILTMLSESGKEIVKFINIKAEMSLSELRHLVEAVEQQYGLETPPSK
jgi:polyhydroxyalkanoate synthesis regulator phasin